MASYTTNLNLKKPAGSENVAIGDINNNMDTIDTAYGTLNSNLNNLLGATNNTYSNVDLNDYKTPGAYYFTTGCSNTPGNYFLCLVITRGTDFVIQLGIYAVAKGSINFRAYASGSWGEWNTLTGT